ncbi:uncharacterized protein PFL1_05449 [Pseudozyma flocculosa PF-1]|uniref:Mitochondrial fission process protein 1 n=2 Tax=Pseudozyma flocculosa TaxID=84751 RepID=A0A5C3FAW6_9BASI|nr:uncharacterized protein PFL1_05449 [Pseudozyma flocculosa PF-1]EPQ27168.1 hypothetical protein PFL1_05449 [Pseudozyma flocculosa PF-1]SPO41246.1 uncharacterized protein PSFLO_06728 [Pseudozyma flocculosa]
MDSLFSLLTLRTGILDFPRHSGWPETGPAGSSSIFSFALRAAASASASASPALASNTKLGDVAPASNTTGLPTPTVDSNEPLLKPTSEQDVGLLRYSAYLARIKTLTLRSTRYLAYTSEVGEAFRPLTRPEVVRAAYAISWLYIIYDVSAAGYRAAKIQEAATPGDGLVETAEKKAIDAAASLGIDRSTLDRLNDAQKVELKKRADAALASSAPHHSEGTNVALIMARRAVFQSIASMALPAFTIHSIVKYSAPLFAKASNLRIRAMGPTIAGLAFVPALPFLFDHPVEHAVDLAFDWAQEAVLGGGGGGAKEKTQ